MSTRNNNKEQKEETILIIVGSLLIIISLILFHYNEILEVSNEVYNDIQSKIFKEQTSLNSLEVNIDVDYVESDTNVSNEEQTSTLNYIAFLEIDKISLRQGLLPKESYYNNVNFHVEILDLSDFPDVVGGNFILAGHSGNSNIAYFKNLYKLELGDLAKVYYKSKVYKYKIVNIYNENKDGALSIYRNPEKTTLTLITCTKDDKEHQTVYILELMGVESY